MAKLHSDILSEEKVRQRKIKSAKEAVIKAAEERKAMIAAANAKKKTTGKGKKGKEEPKPEEVEVKEVKKVKEERKELDLLKPEDFD